MCLVWRGGPSSWNIWTRSVPRSSPRPRAQRAWSGPGPGLQRLSLWAGVRNEGLSPGLIWTWVHPPDVDTHSGMQLDPIKPAKPVSPGRSHQAGQAGQASQTSHTWLSHQASLTWLSHQASLTWLGRRPRLRGSGAASGAQALHQQIQRSAQARCRKTAFFLHARFFYILSTHHP